MRATVDTALNLTHVHLFYSTTTTAFNFTTAGYIPVEMVFFNENTVPSLTARWQGPSSTIFTVSIFHPSSCNSFMQLLHLHCRTSNLCCQAASDHPFVSSHAVCLETEWAALSMHCLQHQSSPVFPVSFVMPQSPCCILFSNSSI